MEETRRKFDADFKEGAVRLVRETGKPIAHDRAARCPQSGMASSDRPCGLSSSFLSQGQRPRVAGCRRRPGGGRT